MRRSVVLSLELVPIEQTVIISTLSYVIIMCLFMSVNCIHSVC